MALQPAKVVYINTQYVETDASSFKSVVQNLTGKDSVVPGEDRGPVKARRRRRFPVGGDVRRQPEMEKPEMVGCRSSFLMRDMSFKEFDRLLKELPPLDDFHTLFDL